MFKLLRSPKNPILTPTKNWWENKAVFNCGVYEYQNSLYLLYRAQGDDEISRFGLARMKDYQNVSERNPEPFISPEPSFEYESAGVEDPRITKIDNMYYILYTSAAREVILNEIASVSDIQGWDVRVSIAETSDFRLFRRRVLILHGKDTKNAVLFPEKIKGKYTILYRVIPDTSLAESDDLVNFQDRGLLFAPRRNYWDSLKVGPGAPPIKTPFGWLLFYHGVDENSVYRLGVIVLDEADPRKILCRSDESILGPEKDYEKFGRVNNVVFTCGATEDSQRYYVYYGAADRVICMATVEKKQVFDWIKSKISIPSIAVFTFFFFFMIIFFSF